MKLSIALAQIGTRLGDVPANLEKHLARIDEAAAAGADLVVFPELSLTGYVLQDLTPAVAHTTSPDDPVFKPLLEASRRLDIMVGFVEEDRRNRFYIAAAYLSQGQVLHVHHKVYLPTYGLFDEGRFFAWGDAVRAFDTRFGRLGMLICEDFWHASPPYLLWLDGADLLLFQSASPGRGLNSEPQLESARWVERINRAYASLFTVFTAHTNRVGYEDGLHFWGGSTVYDPNGELIVKAPYQEEALTLAEIDLNQLHRTRARLPLLRDERTALVMREMGRIRGGEKGLNKGIRVSRASFGRGQGYKKDNNGMDIDLTINTELARTLLTGFIRSEIQRVGYTRAVIALSGGIDSALSCYLAVEALGAPNVLAIRMPYKTSSPDSLEHAQVIIDALGIASLTVPITEMVEPLFERFPDMNAVRRGNVMARQRMIVLYDQSEAFHGLVVGTGNKTEILLGYTTLYGDSACALNPLGDLYKTQVRQLSRAVGVPAAVIEKPPSADLWKDQTDEGELGFTYAEVDKLLYLLIDQRYSPADCMQSGFGESFVRTVVERVRRYHFKRILPPIAKVSNRTVGYDFLYLRDWGT